MAYKNKETQKEYQRNWRLKRRNDYFKSKHCEQCGSTKKLELDHIDPKIKITHRIWTWALKRQLKELRKCQILCYACHKRNMRQNTVHGADTMFINVDVNNV